MVDPGNCQSGVPIDGAGLASPLVVTDKLLIKIIVPGIRIDFSWCCPVCSTYDLFMATGQNLLEIARILASAWWNIHRELQRCSANGIHELCMLNKARIRQTICRRWFAITVAESQIFAHEFCSYFIHELFSKSFRSYCCHRGRSNHSFKKQETEFKFLLVYHNFCYSCFDTLLQARSDNLRNVAIGLCLTQMLHFYKTHFILWWK